MEQEIQRNTASELESGLMRWSTRIVVSVIILGSWNNHGIGCLDKPRHDISNIIVRPLQYLHPSWGNGVAQITARGNHRKSNTLGGPPPTR